MLVHSLLIERVYLCRLGESARANDFPGDSFDGCPVSPGEKKLRPLVRVSMPPMPLEYQGRDVVARFSASIFRRRAFDLVPTRANSQPAFGAYLRSPPREAGAASGIRPGTGLFVLTLSGDRICAMTRFDSNVLPWFGLPRSLPG
jgi:hypothetical protein